MAPIDRDGPVPAPDVVHAALLVGGQWITTEATLPVRDVDSGRLVGSAPIATRALVAQALAAAAQGVSALHAVPRHRRAEVLSLAASRLAAHSEHFARVLASEGIKTIREARGEVARCARTLRLCAEHAVADPAESLTLTGRGAAGSRHARWHRQAVGMVAAITPFNDPLNLVAHKLGPAIAVGAPVLLKPHERTPLSAWLLVKLLLDAGMHPLQVQLLTGLGADIGPLICGAPEVRAVSFTGGRDVGALVAAQSQGKLLSMELGGACPTIVMPDADIGAAASAIVEGAAAAAGQNCLHVQRVLAQRAVLPALQAAILEHSARIRVGPKLDERSTLGPLISAAAIERTARLVLDATHHGAQVLSGGTPSGAGFALTWLGGVTTQMQIARTEAFVPISTLEPFDSIDDALRLAAVSGPALQAGLFTDSASAIQRCVDGLQVGAVVVNDSSDYRDDAMPFGGPGAAGMGREGVRFAAEAFTEPKLVVTR